jgi:hypothetical protein
LRVTYEAWVLDLKKPITVSGILRGKKLFYVPGPDQKKMFDPALKPGDLVTF